VHAPLALAQDPLARHVTLGAGVPKNPLLQVAVQLEPAVMFAAQLKEPPSGFNGGVLHTASRMAVKYSQRSARVKYSQRMQYIQQAPWAAMEAGIGSRHSSSRRLAILWPESLFCS
jgi:hypothetical protein